MKTKGAVASPALTHDATAKRAGRAPSTVDRCRPEGATLVEWVITLDSEVLEPFEGSVALEADEPALSPLDRPRAAGGPGIATRRTMRSDSAAPDMTAKGHTREGDTQVSRDGGAEDMHK